METKTCSNPGCPEHNPQPLDAFGRYAKARDGLSALCKTCLREYWRQYRASERGKKAISRAKAKYRHGEKNRAAQRRYRRTLKGQMYRRLANQRFRSHHPMARRAEKLVNRAVQRGDIAPASGQVCYVCGQPAREYHHHLGYSPEHAKDVQPMCPACHRKTERGRPSA